jgi:pilus assembly protein Flp/PilA
MTPMQGIDARATIRAFVRDSSGATAIEYAFIAGFLSIAIAVAVINIGGIVTGMFQSVVDAFPS